MPGLVRPGVSVGLGLLLGLTATACGASSPAAPTPVVNADVALYERVCHGVVAAFRIGARPSAVEVEVPPSEPSGPPARITLVAPHVPLAEQCLGLPMPRLAQASAPSAPQPPSTPPAVPETPLAVTQPSVAPPATPPSVPRPAATNVVPPARPVAPRSDDPLSSRR